MRNRSVFLSIVLILSVVVLGCSEATDDILGDLTGGTNGFDAWNLRASPNPVQSGQSVTLTWDFKVVPSRVAKYSVYINGEIWSNSGWKTWSGEDTAKYTVYADWVIDEHGYGTHTFRVHMYDEDNVTAGNLSVNVTIR